MEEKIARQLAEKVKLTAVSKDQGPSWWRRLGLAEDRTNFVDNLIMLLAAGMDIFSALEAIKSEVRSKRMRFFIDQIINDIEAGLPLWRALDKIKIFPTQVISLVRIGESSGRLVENLQVVSLQQQKESNFKSKIRSAMMYPVFVLSVTLVVGLSIAWFILPKLARVFSGLKVELPLITKILIGVGSFMGTYGYFAVPLVLLLFSAALYFFFVFTRTKFIGQYVFFHLPGIKKLLQQTELSRLGYILGTLLQAGLPLIDSINSLSTVTEVRFYQKFYVYLRDSVEEGNSFKKSFANYPLADKLFPKSIQQLIVAGEQSGSLPESLIKVGENFEQKIDITTKNLSVILEPLLLFIVWLGVLAVAVAVILPIYSLVGSFQH